MYSMMNVLNILLNTGNLPKEQISGAVTTKNK